MSGILPALLLCAASVHPDTIHDIARIESRFNPYAIVEISSSVKGGLISYSPKTKEDVLTLLQRLKNSHRRYSVGLMQISSSNFNTFKVTPEDMLDACKNLNVFEKILVSCYQRGGNLKSALSCYYSGNFTTGQRKEKPFHNTSYIERIGYSSEKQVYKVPSTKIDKEKTDTKESLQRPKGMIIYPDTVLKSSFVDTETPTKLIGH